MPIRSFWGGLGAAAALFLVVGAPASAETQEAAANETKIEVADPVMFMTEHVGRPNVGDIGPNPAERLVLRWSVEPHRRRVPVILQAATDDARQRATLCG